MFPRSTLKVMSARCVCVRERENSLALEIPSKGVSRQNKRNKSKGRENLVENCHNLMTLDRTET